MPSAERLISSLRAEKLKLTESHARLKPKLKSAKQELAVKSIASVPTGMPHKMRLLYAAFVSFQPMMTSSPMVGATMPLLMACYHLPFGQSHI